MKQYLLIFAGLLWAGLSMGQSLSPQLYSSSGTVDNSNNTELSWAIGEAIVATYSQISLILSQGYEQADYIITAIESPSQSLQASVYPVPTKDVLNIDLQGQRTKDVQVELISISGQILNSGIVLASESHLRLTTRNLSTGTYFLRLRTDSEAQNFKIQKIN